MKLSKDEVKKIADLARLELTDVELKKYGEQLSSVLSYIDQLKEVNTDEVEPTAQVAGLVNKMREDAVEEWPDDETESALSQAPEKQGRNIKVKRVLG